MPPKVKKSYGKNKTIESAVKENDTDNIIPSRLRTLRERNKKVTYNDSITLSEDERMHNENLKPLGFWSKKLKDLESTKIITKERKYELYDFNESDDSFSPKKRRKKNSKKCGVAKEKQHDFKLNMKKTFPKKKKVVVQEVSDKNLKENIISSKEKGIKAKKELNFGFSSILTSTPAMNKSNIISASNFMFISPLLKLDDIQSHQESIDDHETPVKNNLVKTKTLKQQNNLTNHCCTKVLRNKKNY